MVTGEGRTTADLIAEARQDIWRIDGNFADLAGRLADALEKAAANLADAEQTLVELKPADVLVEGSWFAVDDLPTILGNFMRSSADYAREAKRYLIELEQIRRLHEVATEQNVKLAAVIEEIAQRAEDSIDARYGTISAAWLAKIIESADSSAVLAEHDAKVAAKAWTEGLHKAYNHVDRLEEADAAGQGVTISDPVNPYRQVSS